jgi:hypothetical protein
MRLFQRLPRRARLAAGLLAILASVIPLLARGELAACDGAGRVIALRCDGDFVPVITDVRVFLPGWTGAPASGPGASKM